MNNLLYIVLFVICLGSTAAAILVLHQMTKDYKSEFLNNYFYYLISFLTFCLYATWGQILLRYLMTEFDIAPGIIDDVSYLIPVLGFPFVLIAGLMLIRLAVSIDGKKMESIYILLYFLLFLILTLTCYFVIRFTGFPQNIYIKTRSSIILGFVLVETFWLVIFIILSARSISKIDMKLKKSHYKIFLLLFILSWLLRYGFLPFIYINHYLVAIFLMFLFASFLLPLFYIWKNADDLFPQVSLEDRSGIDLSSFCQNHGISNRESQIIDEICQGKSNKQIAEELFISLQTVKDHTHRIYTKIGINSRMQLLQMVKVGR